MLKKMLLICLLLVSPLSLAFENLPFGTKYKACDEKEMKCVAVGVVGSGLGCMMYAYFTENGTCNWQHTSNVPIIPRAFDITALSCNPDLTYCVATGWQCTNMHCDGTTVLKIDSHDGGRTWKDLTW